MHRIRQGAWIHHDFYDASTAYGSSFLEAVGNRKKDANNKKILNHLTAPSRMSWQGSRETDGLPTLGTEQR
jgi:hypothetical protein